MNLNSYNDFKNEMIKLLEGRIGDGRQIKVASFLKNNSKKKDGVTCFCEGTVMSPTIYLNDYYELYRTGSSIEELADKISQIFNTPNVEEFDFQIITDFERAKSRIAYKIINKSRNEELLKNVPYIEYMDLAIVFFFLISKSRFENATIQVSNNLMEVWKCDIDTLYSYAKENTPKLLNYDLQRIEELCKNMLDEEELLREGIEFNDIRQAKPPMYVLSNVSKLYGAGTMLYEDVLLDLAKDLMDDLYILPSSIHEIILVPAKFVDDVSELKSMVREVNESSVEVEDYLSDSVYMFSKEDGKICVY